MRVDKLMPFVRPQFEVSNLFACRTSIHAPKNHELCLIQAGAIPGMSAIDDSLRLVAREVLV